MFRQLALILYTTICLFFPWRTRAGFITPDPLQPIVSSVANKGELSDYTITFAPETAMDVGTIVSVEFPSQFRSGLGIPINPICSVSCTISENVVLFTTASSVPANSSYSVTIKNVENPETKGGTGSFKVLTKKGVNILDQNLIFGTIGIANSVSDLIFPNVQRLSGSPNTGQVNQYAFYFKVSQYILAGSFFKITITDTNFGLAANPACSALQVNGKIIQGTLTCQTTDRDIIVSGLSASIPANQDVGIQIEMVNPIGAGTTEPFNIAVLRGGTSVIYDRKNDVAGVEITPSPLTSVSFAPLDSVLIQGKGKLMDYVITFKTANPLPFGSAIGIVLPADFQIDTSSQSVHFIKYGLEDPSESSPTGMELDTTNSIVKITNFKAVAAGELIEVQLRLLNPMISGATSSGIITTYTDATFASPIDRDDTNTFTTISSAGYPISYSITTQNLVANTVQTQIEFEVTPAAAIPSGAYIKVRFPSTFTVGTILASSCLVFPNGGSYVTATCTKSGNVVSITLPVGVSFTTGTVNYFRFDNLIKTPISNSTSLIGSTSYQTDGTTILESWASPFSTIASSFTSQSASSLCVGDSKTTVLTFTFVPSTDLAASAQQTSTNDVKGFIEFTFSGVATDLGSGLTSTGTIPCLATSGLNAISGSIQCTLTPGSSPVILVTNFQAVTSGTTVKILFPKISNPTPVPSSNSYSVTIITYTLANRVRTDLNEATVSIPVQTAGSLTQSGNVASTTYTFTNNQVSQSTDLTFNSRTTSAITGPGTFIVQLPFYDIGWVRSSSTITCQLAGVAATCVGFPGVDWIAITLTTGSFAINAAITIQGLMVPRYSITLGTGPILRFVDSAQQETINIQHTVSIPAAIVPTFSSASLTAGAMGAGAVNVLYTFSFTTPIEIPSGASIAITFPTGYNLLASNPSIQISSTNLAALSSSSPVSFSTAFSQITITNFSTIAAGSSFTIMADHVKNPTGQTISSGWSALVTYASGSGQVISHSNFDQFTYAAASATYYLTVNSITAFPMNALEEAVYTISFTPVTPIPAYGDIRITFPSANYKRLPSPPDCQVSGGITTYKSCSLSGSVLIIVLDTQYTSGMISVVLRKVKNPSPGTTNLFKILTSYDGKVLDDTETIVTTNRFLTFENSPSSIEMKKLTFDPKNEGEQATYTFSFLPSTPLTDDMEIRVIFPTKFDLLLGSKISCKVTSGLEGNIVCTVKDRVVALTGFVDYTSDESNPITIDIGGVVNPNKVTNDDTGQFKVGTLVQQTTSYTDFNAAAGTLETIAAPGWAILWSVEPENLYARTSSDYRFNFSTFSDIPQQALGGAIRIDLPSEFEINDKDMTCESLTSSFASGLSCYITQNRIMITGNQNAYGGNAVVIVRGITNPVSAGVSSDIQIKVYDSFSSQIIERTYQNLDPFSFSYTLPGPLVVINNDEPIVIERGTQTDSIYITTDFPSALNLNFNPSTPGFTVTPFYISLPLGQTTTSFRITVAEDFSLGTYYIEWSALGELIPAYYTPIRRTQVTIVSNQDLVIAKPDVLPIPLGGNSLPINFKLPKGPDSDLIINIEFYEDYPGISLSSSTLQFTAGQKEASLLIYATGTTTVTEGSLLLSLEGTNSAIYSLADQFLNFTLTASDTSTPSLSQFNLIETTMNSVNFSISVSEICMVYYVITLVNSATPSIEEAVNKGPAPYQTTESRYGSLLISTPGQIEYIFVDKLVAETSYTIIAYLVDQGENTFGPQLLPFSTLNRYNAAEFALRFNQASLNEAEIQVCINAVSFLLSLNPWQVRQNKYTTRRRLEQELENHIQETQNFLRPSQSQTEEYSRQLQTTSLLHLQIMAIPNSTLYPSPTDLAVLLNSKKTELSKRLDNFDPSYIITASNFVRYVPTYSGNPTWSDSGYDWSSFTGTLNNYGALFVVCVKKSEDQGTPTSYQVWRGLDNKNVEWPSGSVEVSAASTQFTVNITKLEENTEYSAYIIGGSSQPGFPDLMQDSSVLSTTFKTKARPNVTEPTKDKSAKIIQGVATLLFSILPLLLIV